MYFVLANWYLFVMVKNQEKAVMWRSIFKVAINGTELGLRRVGKTCKLCSWAGFATFKKAKP
jgi:hypothetical protein